MPERGSRARAASKNSELPSTNKTCPHGPTLQAPAPQNLANCTGYPPWADLRPDTSPGGQRKHRFGAGARSCLDLEVVHVCPGPPLWPLSCEVTAFDHRAIHTGPHESETRRFREPSPPYSLIPLAGHQPSRRVPAQGHKPAL